MKLVFAPILKALGLSLVVLLLSAPLPSLQAKTKVQKVPNVELPVCNPSSPHPKIQIVSWQPHQKASKIIGTLRECVTTMWDVLALLPGPNVIDVEYPSEKERWGYIWMWSYKLANPVEDSIILMDKPGKRLRKGKNPVELYLVFDKNDVLEKVEMIFVKGKLRDRY